MDIKLILLDLDGTLLTSEKTISPANYAALKRAWERGIHIVPSTGRFFAGMPQVVRDMPFFRYAVTVNGARVCDRRTDTVLRRCEITPDDAKRIFARLDTLPGIYDCFLDGWGYMGQRDYDRIDRVISEPWINSMVKALRRPVEDLPAFVEEQNRPLQKIQMFFADAEARRSAWAQLREEFPRMAVTSSLPINVEINAGDANKGEALRFLCRHLGLDICRSMAFGDGSNDLTMIRAAGIGVAMGNAGRELKEAADWVTASNDEDGVARALEKFVF